MYPGAPKGVPGTTTTPALLSIKAASSISFLRLFDCIAFSTLGNA